MDRGMEMGQDGEPSGAAPLRDASRPNLAALLICTGCGHDSRVPIAPPALACCPDNRYRTISEILQKAAGECRHSTSMEVEWIIDLLARSAPEAASAEGSPSHPSGPSQDSGAPLVGKPGLGLEDIIKSLEWLASEEAAGQPRAWYQEQARAAAWQLRDLTPARPSQDSQEVTGLKARIVLILDSYYRDEDVGIAEAADALLAILSQSPKGAALSGSIAAGGATGLGVTSKEPSAPKTGLRGAPRRKDALSCGAKSSNGHQCQFPKGHASDHYAEGETFSVQWVQAPGDVGEAGGAA